MSTQRREKILMRTTSAMMSDFPDRQTIRNANYSRRHRQQTEQGYYSSELRPYSLIGDTVILSTKKLIKESLNMKIEETTKYDDNDSNVTSEDEKAVANISLNSIKKTKNSSFVQNRVNKQKRILKLVQNGHSLFDKFEAERLEKEREVEILKEKKRQEWNEVDSCSSDSDVEILYTENTNDVVSNLNDSCGTSKRPRTSDQLLQVDNRKYLPKKSERPKSSLFNPSRFGLGSPKNRFVDESSIFRQICSLAWILENTILYPDLLPYKISQSWNINNVVKERQPKRSSVVKMTFNKPCIPHLNSINNLRSFDFDCIESVSSFDTQSEETVSSFQIDIEFDKLKVKSFEHSIDDDEIENSFNVFIDDSSDVQKRRDWPDGRLMLSERIKISKELDKILRSEGQSPQLPLPESDSTTKIRDEIKKKYNKINSAHIKNIVERQNEFQICQKDNNLDFDFMFEDMNRSRNRVASARLSAMSSLNMTNFTRDIKTFRDECLRQEQMYQKLQLKSNKCDKWYLLLKSKLDESVRLKWKFREVLQKLMVLSLKNVGKLEINKSRFYKVLKTLKEYEIRNPDIFASIGFISQFVFVIDETKFNQWLVENFQIK